MSPVKPPGESTLRPLHIAGKVPQDVELVGDFFRRYDEAIWQLATTWELPTGLWEPQKVIPGLARVTDHLYESAVHPRYLVDGMFLDLKWKCLLDLMYPGGSYKELLVWENVQGHPDYICGPPHSDMLIEVKTAGKDKWVQVKRGPVHPNQEQTLTYLKMANRRVGLLVYECRDDLEIFVHVIRRGSESE